MRSIKNDMKPSQLLFIAGFSLFALALGPVGQFFVGLLFLIMGALVKND